MDKFDRTKLHLNIVITFVLGVIWGLLELFANAYLVGSNIFTKGLIFSTIAVVVLVFSKKMVSYKFSLLIVAAIALVLVVAARGFSINIAVAILAEAFIAEILFQILDFKSLTAVIIGILIFLYSFIHSLIFHCTVPESYIVYLYRKMFDSLVGISLTKDSYTFLIIFFGFVSLIIGMAAGLLSFRIVDATQKRIRESIDHYILSE